MKKVYFKDKMLWAWTWDGLKDRIELEMIFDKIEKDVDEVIKLSEEIKSVKISGKILNNALDLNSGIIY